MNASFSDGGMLRILPEISRPGAAERPAGAGAGMLSVTRYGGAVDDDGANARGEATGVVVGRHVRDRGGIEDHEIGKCAGTHGTATGEPELRGRHAGHFVDGGGQVDQALVADVVTENPREASIEAWVRLAARRGHTVRADHGRRVGEHG